MNRHNEILLFSGGVDSVIAYFYLNKPPLLHINTKSKYSEREYSCMLKFDGNVYKDGLPKIYTYNIKLSHFEQLDSNIPARNLLLLTIGSQYADTVYLVAQRGEDRGPDRCGSFFKRVSQILTDCHQRKIVCDQVFPSKTKQDMVSWYLKQNLPIEYLLDAYSCYSGYEKPCSTCPACFRKFVGLSYNNIEGLENIYDISKLMNSETTNNYIKKMLHNDLKYDKKRTKQTLSVIRKYRKL